ncbi:ABC transporter substrate-binding protein [Desulfonema magnum]|nr:ABC transporter substrate binding protein [Desulfonema magnum]
MNNLKVNMTTLISAIILFFILLLPASAANWSTDPKLNNGVKWRVGCYEGGEYIDYQKVLIATIRGLMDLGWIETTEIPQQEAVQTRNLWNWLATEAKSTYLQFVKDAHYSAKWDKTIRKKMAVNIINRLNKQKDIDLMFAMGTWAGQDMANTGHKVRTMVMSCSDPVASGIVKSVEDSGYDHVHARVDPFRYERQVWIFHNIIKFKKLGMIYENSPEGRIYTALDKVEGLSKRLGFEIVTCYTQETNTDLETVEQRVKKCFRELGKKADAIYVTALLGVNKKTVPDLVKIANFHRIPTFSQTGPEGVSQGFLMTISLLDFKELGKFHATMAAKIMNGAKPRQLPMFVNLPYKWHFNFETAEKIGLDISKLDFETDYIYPCDFLSDETKLKD